MALDFLAGCLGGCVGVLVGHPFDTVKVRLQLQSAANPIYKGTFDAFSSIVKKESTLGLYKGIKSPLYGLAAINAVVFGVQGNVLRRFENPDKLSSHYLAGSIAGFAQCVICSPMELAKTRMQMEGQGESLTARRSHKQSTIKGPIEFLTKIYKVEGIRGVFKGFGLTCIREGPSFGIYFAAYEFFVRSLHDSDSGKNVGALVLFFSGGMAGICSWLSTYPFDVLKSRIQGDAHGKYNGMIDCAKKSYAEEGAMVFTRGLGSTLMRAFPVNAATFATVTWVLRYTRSEGDENYIDFTEYQTMPLPRNANIHLTMLPNFPSHP